MLWKLVARIEWLNERARYIPSQTDPTVGLLRNMSRSFYICIIQSIWVPQVFYSSLRSSGEWKVWYTPHKRYFIMFVRGHTVLFLCLCDLGNKERHKAATPNCVSQRIVCGVWSGACHGLLVFVRFNEYRYRKFSTLNWGPWKNIY